MTNDWKAPQEIVLGDFVETDTHGHRGRVYKVHPGYPAGLGCPESDQWLAGQEPQPLTAYKNDRWLSVLVHQGGAISVPAVLARRVEPFEFRNDYANQYFRPASAPRVEIVHGRDPDSECGLTVFVDGVVVKADVEDIDPGRGYLRSDWDERLDSLRNAPGLTEEFRAHALSTLEAYSTSKYIEEG